MQEIKMPYSEKTASIGINFDAPNKKETIIIKPKNKNKYDKSQTYYYLYPKMKEFLDEKLQKKIEKKIINNLYFLQYLTYILMIKIIF